MYLGGVLRCGGESLADLFSAPRTECSVDVKCCLVSLLLFGRKR
jgi:hypothetical protein